MQNGGIETESVNQTNDQSTNQTNNLIIEQTIDQSNTLLPISPLTLAMHSSGHQSNNRSNSQSNNQSNDTQISQLNSPSYVVDVEIGRSSSAPSAAAVDSSYDYSNNPSNSASPFVPWRSMRMSDGNSNYQSGTDDLYSPSSRSFNQPLTSSLSQVDLNRRVLYCSIFFFICFFIFFIEYIYVDRTLHLAEEKRFETQKFALQTTELELQSMKQSINQAMTNITLKDEWIDDLLMQLSERDRALALYRDLTQELQNKEAETEAEQAASLLQAQVRAQAILNQTAAILQSNSHSRAKVETVTRVDEIGEDVPAVSGVAVAAAQVLVDGEGNNYVLSKPSDSSLKTVDNRLIVDLGVVIISSAIGGLIASFLKQPVLLGYLIAGSAIGPGGLGLIGQFVQVETLAEFGATFLLFALGVEFNIGKLKKVGRIAIGGGSLALVLCILMTACLTYLAFSWKFSKGFFIGAVLSMSSTTVVMKSLMERKQINTSIGQIMLGLLIVQDLFLSLILSVLALVNVPSDEMFGAVLIHFFKFMLLGVIVVGASYVWPLVLKMLDHSRSHDLFLLGLVALCVMLTVTSERIIGSAEVGAFLSGILISSSPTAEPALIQRSLRLFEPIRDFFGAVFFSSMGMLIHPQSLLNSWFWIAMFVPATIAMKTCITVVVCRVFNQSWANSIHVALCLSQIGEFSFILSSQGLRAGLLDHDDYMMLLGVTAVSIFVTPGLIAGAYAVRGKLSQNQLTNQSINQGKTHSLGDTADGAKGYELVNLEDNETNKSSTDHSDNQWDDDVVVPSSNTPVQRSHVSSSSQERTAQPADRVQTTNHSSTQLNKSPFNQSINQPINQSINQPNNQSNNQPINLNPPANWREARRQRQIARARRLAAEDTQSNIEAAKLDDESKDDSDA